MRYANKHPVDRDTLGIVPKPYTGTDEYLQDRRKGERLAVLYAGPWPVGGTLEECRAAVERSRWAYGWAGSVEYRWVCRYRIWELPEEQTDRQAARIRARKELAREIMENRDFLLKQMVQLAMATAGCA